MTRHYKDGRFCGGCIRLWDDHGLFERVIAGFKKKLKPYKDYKPQGEFSDFASALQFFLRVFRGFPESSLYEDYKTYEGFSDGEYDENWKTLESVAKAQRK